MVQMIISIGAMLTFYEYYHVLLCSSCCGLYRITTFFQSLYGSKLSFLLYSAAEILLLCSLIVFPGFEASIV